MTLLFRTESNQITNLDFVIIYMRKSGKTNTLNPFFIATKSAKGYHKEKERNNKARHVTKWFSKHKN